MQYLFSGIVKAKSEETHPSHRILLFLLIFFISHYSYASDANTLQLSTEEQTWLEENPDISIGVMQAWPPHSFTDHDGTLQGIAVDYINALNLRLNGKLKMVPGAWNQIYDDTVAGKLDAVIDITPNPRREPFFNFTTPHLVIPHVIVARKDTPYIDSPEAMAGISVALEKGFVNNLVFQEKYPDVLRKQYKDTSAALGAVARGEADAYVGNRAVAIHIMESEVMVNLKVHGRMAERGSTLAIGTRKDAPLVRDILQKALNTITRQEKQAILDKWVDIEETKPFEKPQLTAEEKQWLSKHPDIRVGVMDAWPPFDFVDENGNPMGIGVDYIEALNRRLNGTLKIVPGPWKEIYDDVVNQRLDAILDITPKPSREADFNFTTPYLDVPHVIVAPKNSPYITSEEALDGKIVALEKSFGNVRYFQENYPGVYIKQYRDTSAALDAVVRGEADAYAGNRAVATYLMDREVIVNLKVHGRMKKKGSILAIGTRKDWPILRDILQKALASITSDESLAILRKWTGDKIQTLEKVVLSDAEKVWLKAHPKITLGTDKSWLPYVVLAPENRVMGVEADLLKRINELTGTNIQLTTGKWSELVESAKAREIDGLAVSAYHEERETHFLFTDSPYRIFKYIYTHSSLIKSMSNLAGKRVGLLKGNRLEEKLLNRVPDIILVPVDDDEALISLLDNRRADAIIGGIDLRLSAQEKMTTLTSFIVPGSETKMLYSIRKDWPELHSIINKALAAIPLGERIAILEKWGGKFRTESVTPELQLTNEERAWLSEHNSIRLAVDHAWPPVEWLDEKGLHQGITSEYLGIIKNMLAVEVLPNRKVSWTDLLKMAKLKEVDLFPAIVPTAKRREYLNFTSPYLDFPIVAFTRDDAPLITDLSDLQGKRVAIEKGFSIIDDLQRDYPRLELTTYPTTEEVLRALSLGRVDAYVGNLTVAGYLISKTGLTNIKVAAPTEYNINLSIGVRKDWPELIPILDRALLMIDEEQRHSIRQNWLKLQYETGIDYTLVKQIVVGAVFIILLILLWVLSIQRQKKALTLAKAETEQANIKLKEMDQLKSMFIASISHELRTPLNSIIGFSGMMMRGAYGQLGDKYQDYITRINNSGQHLLSLITDIIDISKLESGRIDIVLADFELDELVTEADKSIRQQIENKGMSLETNIPPGISLHTDRKRLLQCLLNFLSNAMKYSERGTIRVTVSETPKTIQLSIRDTGIGISEEDQERLFEAFERFDSHLRVKAGGTGLGLYLTKKIATDLLQGEVGVKSIQGEGSTFWIEIPRSISTQQAKMEV